MSSRRLLIENISSLAALQALNYLAPLITLPYLVRVLQPSHFGLVSLAQGIVLYFDFFTDFGFNFSQTRAIASCRQVPEAVSRIFWSTIYAKFLLMCISAVALTLLVACTPKMRDTPLLYAVNFLYVIGTTFFPVWLFQGLEKMKLGAVLFGIARLLTIPALFLFVRHPQDYVIAGAIQASVEVLASVFAWPFILKRFQLRWYPPSFIEIVSTLRQSWALFLSASALQFSASGTIVILGFTAGKIEVGYFSAADKLIKAASAALNPLAQALYPHTTAAKLRSPEAAFRLIRKAFLLVGAFSIVVSVLTALFAGSVCHIVLGKTFEHSIPLLRCLSPLPLLCGLTSILGTQTMLVFEMDAILTRLLLFSILLGIPVTAILSISFGALGAAAGSVITAALILTAMWSVLYSKKMLFWQRSNSQAPLLASTSCVALD